MRAGGSWGLLAALAASTIARETLADPPAPRPGAPVADKGMVLGAAVSDLAPLLGHGSAGCPFCDPPYLGAGPAVGISGAYRWDWFFLGASYQHGFLGGGTSGPIRLTDSTSGNVRTLWAASDYLGVDLVAITAPQAFLAAYFHLAVGARLIRVRADGPYEGGTAYRSTWANVDIFLGLGPQFRVGPIRIVPELGLGGGPLDIYGQIGVTAYVDFAPGLP